MDFLNKLKAAWDKNNSLLCVGLDPDSTKLPEGLPRPATAYFDFNKAIIDATADLVCAYKPNTAFYEARGSSGIEELKKTCDYLHQSYSDLPIILDFKRGDIGNTNNYYATFAFDYLGVDAVTIQPWLGRDAVQPFLDYKDKGIMVLDRTSNPGAGEFQDLEVGDQKLYLRVARNVHDEWNANSNCQLVVGATFPPEMAEIRQLVGDSMVFLVPGFGAQGGEAEAVIKAGLNGQGQGLIINSSRSILYASNRADFAEAARAAAQKARAEINTYRTSHD